jgi:hypothetical protein
MLMQNAAGNFEAYRYEASIHGFSGTAMGTMGPPWVVDGIAADPPIGAGTSASQLVQAMAGFTDSSGAGDSLKTAPLSADTSHRTFLTTPHA